MDANKKALRKALSDACYAMFNFLKSQNGGYEEMAKALDKAKAALSAPPRNCDVGTPSEQRARFDKFCRSNSWDEIDGAHCMSSCPLYHGDCSRCEELEWAQMPYSESEAGE